MINIIYKSFWVFWVILILFFREHSIGKPMIFLLGVALSVIAVKRAINAREDWRPIAEEYHKELED